MSVKKTCIFRIFCFDGRSNKKWDHPKDLDVSWMHMSFLRYRQLSATVVTGKTNPRVSGQLSSMASTKRFDPPLSGEDDEQEPDHLDPTKARLW